MKIRELTRLHLAHLLQIRKINVRPGPHVAVAIKDILCILIHIIIDFPGACRGGSCSEGFGRRLWLAAAAYRPL